MGKKLLTEEQKKRLRELLKPILNEIFNWETENLEILKNRRIRYEESHIDNSGIMEELKNLSAKDLTLLNKLDIEIKYDQIHLKGLALNQTGKYKDSLLLYEIALKLYSRDPRSWLGKATALYLLGDFVEAAECYDESIKYAYDFPKMTKYAYFNKALTLLELNRIEESISYLLLFGAEYLKKLTTDELYSYFENLDFNTISLLIIEIYNRDIIYFYHYQSEEVEVFDEEIFLKLGIFGIKILIAFIRNYSLVDKFSGEFYGHFNELIHHILLKFNTSEYEGVLKDELLDLFLNYFLSEFQSELKKKGHSDEISPYFHSYLQQELWYQIYNYVQLISSILSGDEINRFIVDHQLYSNPTFINTMCFAYNEIIDPENAQNFYQKWLRGNYPLITSVEVHGERIFTVNGRLDIWGKRIMDISDIKGLEKLKELEALDLASNKFTKIKGLENLSNLHTLLLFGNQISKIEGLDSLRNLRVLYLTNNKIMKIEGLDSLIHLEELYLGNNEIKKIEGLENLSNLKSLQLSDNQISQIEGLTTLRNLQLLNLTNNNIIEINGLDRLLTLRSLNLANNKIIRIKNLDKLKNLEGLSLDRNQIVEIKSLNMLKSLKNLFLERNKINDIKGLDDLENLEGLYLDYNQIFEIKGLKMLKNLSKLSLKKNKLTEIKGLDNLKNLEELNLDKNQIAEIKGLGMLKNLKSLSLNKNELTDIKELENLVNLEKFSIYRNKIPRELELEIGFNAQDYVKYCQQKKDNYIS